MRRIKLKHLCMFGVAFVMLLSLVLSSGAIPELQTLERFDDGKLVYAKIDGETVAVVGLAAADSPADSLVIPGSVQDKTGKGYVVTQIAQYAFFQSGISGTLLLPEGLEVIGEYAFADCDLLTGELKLPASVTVIEESAFDGCSGLSGALQIPGKVKEIGDFAFAECSALSDTITIPKSVQSIGNFAFDECDGLKTVEVEGEQPFAQVGASIVNHADVVYVKNEAVAQTLRNKVGGARIEIRAATVDAAVPQITNQSASLQTVLQNSELTLSVEASAPDGGVLSYQWYRNTEASTSGGIKLPEAVTNGFRVPTGEIGTFYYYCEITNTNPTVNGNQTAGALSRAMTVTVEIDPAGQKFRITAYAADRPATLLFYPAADGGYAARPAAKATLDQSGIEVELDTLRYTQTVDFTQLIYTDAAGTALPDGLPAGTYKLVVVKPSHVTWQALGVTVTAETICPELTGHKAVLPCGNIGEPVTDGGYIVRYGDDRIKLEDRSVLLRYLNRSTAGDTQDPGDLAYYADLNGDGSITIADLNIMMAAENYNRETVEKSVSGSR